MKYILILFGLFISTFSFSQKTIIECFSCEKIKRGNCSACDEYGAHTEYFSGILVKKRGRSYQIYSGMQVWTKGSTVWLQDWKGNRVSIALNETRYSSIYHLINAINDCRCSDGNNGGGSGIISVNGDTGPIVVLDAGDIDLGPSIDIDGDGINETTVQEALEANRIWGTFVNHTVAGLNGVPIGGIYEIDWGSTIGMAGTLIRRKL